MSINIYNTYNKEKYIFSVVVYRRHLKRLLRVISLLKYIRKYRRIYRKIKEILPIIAEKYLIDAIENYIILNNLKKHKKSIKNHYEKYFYYWVLDAKYNVLHNDRYKNFVSYPQFLEKKKLNHNDSNIITMFILLGLLDARVIYTRSSLARASMKKYFSKSIIVKPSCFIRTFDEFFEEATMRRLEILIGERFIKTIVSKLINRELHKTRRFINFVLNYSPLAVFELIKRIEHILQIYGKYIEDEHLDVLIEKIQEIDKFFEKIKAIRFLYELNIFIKKLIQNIYSNLDLIFSFIKISTLHLEYLLAKLFEKPPP